MSGVFSPTRAKIDKRTLRTDKWWLEPLLTFSVLISFVIYATFRAFENDNYFVKEIRTEKVSSGSNHHLSVRNVRLSILARVGEKTPDICNSPDTAYGFGLKITLGNCALAGNISLGVAMRRGYELTHIGSNWPIHGN